MPMASLKKVKNVQVWVLVLWFQEKKTIKRNLEVQKKLYVEVSYASERVTEVYSSCLMIKGNDVCMYG